MQPVCAAWSSLQETPVTVGGRCPGGPRLGYPPRFRPRRLRPWLHRQRTRPWSQRLRRWLRWLRSHLRQSRHGQWRPSFWPGQWQRRWQRRGRDQGGRGISHCGQGRGRVQRTRSWQKDKVVSTVVGILATAAEVVAESWGKTKAVALAASSRGHGRSGQGPCRDG